MGIFLPMVGYVAARKHNEDDGREWNRKRIAEVDRFVGAMRIAYREGWGEALAPLTEHTRNGAEEIFKIHEKTYEHKIFFDNDLINRPQMKEMINFLMSNPRGGTICVVDKNDLIDNNAEQYTITQCKTVQLMLSIPVLECGFAKNNGSWSNKLARNYGNSQIIQDIVMSALSMRDAHTRRMGAHEFQKRLCDMKTANLSDASAYRAMREAHDAGTLCPDCVTKWASHQNGINPRAQHIPSHKVA